MLTKILILLLAALLGYKLTELLVIKNEYDSQQINANLNDFTQKFVSWGFVAADWLTHVMRRPLSLKE